MNYLKLADSRDGRNTQQGMRAAGNLPLLCDAAALCLGSYATGYGSLGRGTEDRPGALP